MDSKKKLVLTSETLVNLSMKSGLKAGIGLPNSNNVCVKPPPQHTQAKGCVLPR